MTLITKYQITAFGDLNEPVLKDSRNLDELLWRVNDLLHAGYQVLITQQSAPAERVGRLTDNQRTAVAGDPRGEADR